MKPCAECEAVKPLTEFYRHPQTADGHQALCKECHKARMRVRKGSSDRKAYYRERYRQDPERRAKLRAYNKSPRGMEVGRKAKAKYIMNNPEKRKAQNALNNAVRDGKIVAPDACTGCGHVGRLEAHHPDYSKPLDVIWLCKPCHVAEHK